MLAEMRGLYRGGAPRRDAAVSVRCDCGNVRMVRRFEFISGRSQSCGCLKAELQGPRAYRHGGNGTPEFEAWCQMKARCRLKNKHRRPAHAGKGVTVCSRWEQSFPAFLADVGQRPSPAYSLDRYPDPFGNYEPGNVRWATQIEQGRNRRTCRFISLNGVRRNLSEWAEISGIHYSVISGRIKRGWPIELALTAAPGTIQRRRAS